MGERDLPIAGYKDISFVDWEGHICLTIYTPGCNMACPFCHSYSLIDDEAFTDLMNEDDILSVAHQEQGLIDSICITGGEPLLHDIEPFLTKVKDMGLKVKLDTNGTNPSRLRNLVDKGLIDYVAMDYKAPKDNMPYVCRGSFSPDKVEESKDFLINDSVDYEFRTTVVPKMHSKHSLKVMSDELKGAKRWRLQQYRGKDDVGNILIDPTMKWLIDEKPYDCDWYDEIIVDMGLNIEDIKVRGCE